MVLKLHAELLDVKGAFLRGEFKPDRKDIYLEVPKGLEHKHLTYSYLKLLAPIYGLKDAAMVFSCKLVKVLNNLKLTRIQADLYLYFKWRAN